MHAFLSLYTQRFRENASALTINPTFNMRGNDDDILPADGIQAAFDGRRDLVAMAYDMERQAPKFKKLASNPDQIDVHTKYSI